MASAQADETVDRLTVVAHDRYDDIIRRANEPDSIVKVKSIIIGGAGGIPAEPVTPVSVPPVFLLPITGVQATTEAGVLTSPDTYKAKPPSEPIFSTPDEQTVASMALEIIHQQYERKCKDGLDDLRTPDMKAAIAVSTREAMAGDQGTHLEQPDVERIINILVEIW